MTRIDDSGMAETFLSRDHVTFLRFCMSQMPEKALGSRAAKETRMILNELREDFLKREEMDLDFAGDVE